MHYRPEIDGLRALAVLPVVLFHYGINRFSGGFVGVDVFFVISGYLISQLLLQEIAYGRVSVAAFYERRIRRIFPCLFAVLLATGIGASLLLFPKQFDFFSTTVTRVVLFCSNVLFRDNSGYFTTTTETNPLVHTWSLAVEEQFYLGFPLVLVALTRLSRKWMLITFAAIAATSFAWHVRDTLFDPSSAFYMLGPRIWELLTGTLLALCAFPRFSTSLRVGASVCGLVLVFAPTLLYTKDSTLTPGWPVLPVLGSAFIIACSPGTVVATVLSMPPVVFLGRISYSLYMWHWPVLVLGKYVYAGKLSTQDTVALFCVTFVIAVLSWRYVEQPFRKSTRWSRRKIFVGALCAIAIGTASGCMGEAMHGWKSRFSPEVLTRLAQATNDFSPLRRRCHSEGDQDRQPEDACIYGGSSAPRVAVWGDSHAVELAYALAEIGARQNASLVHLTSSACPPAVGFSYGRRSLCRVHNEKVLAWLLSTESLDTVILTGMFGSTDDSDLLIKGIQQTVAALIQKGKHVVFVQPYPTARWPVPLTVAALEERGQLETAYLDEADFRKQKAPYLDAFASLKGPLVSVVSPADRLCHDGRCDLIRDDVVLYFDTHHLTVGGARLVAPLVAQEIGWSDGVLPKYR